MRQIVIVNRTEIDLGDASTTSGAELRLGAGVPVDHDLWRIADHTYREYLKGRMVNDEKITDDSMTIFLGPAGWRTSRFFSAPKFINASASPTERKPHE